MSAKTSFFMLVDTANNKPLRWFLFSALQRKRKGGFCRIIYDNPKESKEKKRPA